MTKSTKIKCYRVYNAPEGSAPSFIGEYSDLDAAVEAAESEANGLEKSQWDTARAAGHCAGLTAPSRLADGEYEADEPLSWHGEDGWHCVVPVYTPLTAEDLEIDHITSILRSHGDMFTGDSRVDDIAREWYEYGFDADTTDEWCSAGFWEPSVADQLCAAGVTPDKATARAKALVEAIEDAGGDAAEEYTDGCPIYAVCNGDTDVAVLMRDAE